MTDAAKTPLRPTLDDPPPTLGSVATDGGPVLLGPRHALTTWEGARADGAPGGDYQDACEFSGRYGSLERHGASILVLPSYAVDVLHLDEGVLWLTLEGNLEELWASRDTLVFASLERTLDAEALVLLDAAHTLERAENEAERIFALPQDSRKYALDEGREAPGGYFLVLRLRPVAD